MPQRRGPMGSAARLGASRRRPDPKIARAPPLKAQRPRIRRTRRRSQIGSRPADCRRSSCAPGRSRVVCLRTRYSAALRHTTRSTWTIPLAERKIRFAARRRDAHFATATEAARGSSDIFGSAPRSGAIAVEEGARGLLRGSILHPATARAGRATWRGHRSGWRWSRHVDGPAASSAAGGVLSTLPPTVIGARPAEGVQADHDPVHEPARRGEQGPRAVGGVDHDRRVRLDHGAIRQGGNLAVVDVRRCTTRRTPGRRASPTHPCGRTPRRCRRERQQRGPGPGMPPRSPGCARRPGSAEPCTSVIVAPGSASVTAACNTSPARRKGSPTCLPGPAMTCPRGSRSPSGGCWAAWPTGVMASVGSPHRARPLPGQGLPSRSRHDRQGRRAAGRQPRPSRLS